MEIFKLFGSIFVDSSEAEKSISKTENKAQGLASKLGAVGKGAAVMGAAVVAGVGAAATGLFKIAESASGAGDRVDKLSQKIGISREAFQEWDYVLGQNGIEVEKLQTGVKTMTDAMGGVGAGAKAFEQLGISVKDSTGKMRSQEDVFEESVKKLQGLEDQTLKAQLAVDLFGKAGTELMPLLNQTAESTEELMNRSHDLGLVMSDEAVDAAVVFGDTMDDVKDAFGALVTQVGIAVMPMFQELLNWILEHLPEIKSVFSAVFGVIKTVVETAVGVFETYLLPIFSELFNWVASNWPAIQEMIKRFFDTVSPLVIELWKIFSEGLLPIFKELYSWVAPWMPAIGEFIFDAFIVGIGVAKELLGWINDVIGGIRDAIEWFGKLGKKQDASNSGTNFGVGGTEQLREFIDGSHASGLDYVPYDGYVAELHKGERVLTDEERQMQDRYGVYTTERQELVISGKLVIEGVNDDGVFIKAAEYAFDKFHNQLRKEARLK